MQNSENTNCRIQNAKYKVRITQYRKIQGVVLTKSFSSKAANGIMQPCCNFIKRQIWNTKCMTQNTTYKYKIQNTPYGFWPRAFHQKLATIKSMIQSWCNFIKRNYIFTWPHIGIQPCILELTMKHWTQAKYMILWVKCAWSIIYCWWCFELVEKVSCWFSLKAAEKEDYSAIL